MIGCIVHHNNCTFRQVRKKLVSPPLSEVLSGIHLIMVIGRFHIPNEYQVAVLQDSTFPASMQNYQALSFARWSFMRLMRIFRVTRVVSFPRDGVMGIDPRLIQVHKSPTCLANFPDLLQITVTPSNNVIPLHYQLRAALGLHILKPMDFRIFQNVVFPMSGKSGISSLLRANTFSTVGCLRWAKKE